MTPPDEENPAWRERIRITDIQLHRSDERSCRVEVELTLAGSARSVGEAGGEDTPEGRMKAGADATLDALVPVLRGRLELQLVGVRTHREFDSFLVLAAVHGVSGGEEYSLIGAVAVPEDQTVRGAVLAVLDSANRVVERYAMGGAGTS